MGKKRTVSSFDKVVAEAYIGTTSSGEDLFFIEEDPPYHDLIVRMVHRGFMVGGKDGDDLLGIPLGGFLPYPNKI